MNAIDFNTQLIKEINSVRINPKSYADKLMAYEKYFDNKVFRYPGHIALMTNEGFSAVKEAADFLYQIKSIGGLKEHTLMNDVAYDMMKVNNSDTGNAFDIDEIIKSHGEYVGSFAQSIDFGSLLPELVVLHLLADDGDLSRGNRENLLNSNFKLIGVSNGNHKKYNKLTVICLARHFFAKGEDHGVLSDDCYEKDKGTFKIIEKGESRSQYSYEQKREPNKQKSSKKVTIVEEEEVIEKPTLTKSSSKKIIEISETTQPYQKKCKSSSGMKQVDISQTANKSNLKCNTKEADYDSDFDLPENVVKIEKKEKEVVEGNKVKKIIKITKYMTDGSIEKEIIKKDK